jgi:hypothetical protein
VWRGGEEAGNGAVDACAARVGPGVVHGCEVDPAGDDRGLAAGVQAFCGGQEAGEGGASLAARVRTLFGRALRGAQCERQGNEQGAGARSRRESHCGDRALTEEERVREKEKEREQAPMAVGKRCVGGERVWGWADDG